MTKLQKSKKGFTLTELAIVIAVIAILIAVLVPTFVSLINKAEESSDKQLVKNLNTGLSVSETTSTINTMSDAVEAAEANGYNVANLNPTSSGYKILWDQVSNRFLLIDEDNTVVYADSSTGLTEGSTLTSSYTYWYIVESEAEYNTAKETDYSLYIATDELTSVSSNGGVDYAAGITSVETKVTATSSVSQAAVTEKTLAKKALTAESGSSVVPVIVKTNGGTLTLNVSGEVAHYGTATTVTVSSTSTTATYTSYAEVTANVVVATTSVSVVTTTESTVTAVLITATESTGISVTNNSSTSIEIAATKENVASTVSGNSSGSTTPVTETISTVFAGGLGTESNPYQIATATQLANIGTLSSDMVSGKTYYFQLTSDITWNHTQGTYITEYLNGVFDGNGYSITISADVGTSASGYGDFWFFEKPINTTVKNLTIYETSFNLAITYGWDTNGTSSGTLTFENVKIGDKTCVSTSLMAYKNTSAFISYYKYGTLTFNDCINYYSYQSDDSGAYMAVFLGGYANSAKVTFNGCINYGTLKLPYAGVFIGNGSYAKGTGTSSTYTVSNCENYGDIYSYESGSLIAAINSSDVCSDVKAIFNEGVTVTDGDVNTITDSNLKLTYDTKNSLTLASQTSYSQYLLTYSRYASYKSKDSTSSGTSQITISFDVSVGSIADWGYGIKFYDLTSYKSLENAQDVSSLKKLTDEYYSCSLEGAIVYYDSSNNAFVVDYSSVESENGLVYTLSGAATIKVAAYTDNKLKAISNATAASN